MTRPPRRPSGWSSPIMCTLGPASRMAAYCLPPVASMCRGRPRRETCAATRATLASLQKTLEGLGASRASIVSVKAFMHPMADAAVMTEEVATFFGGERVPPVVLVDWISSLPIEIEVVASTGAAPSDDPGPLEFITPPGMTASPVFCRVVRSTSRQTIYISGLFGRGGTSGQEQVQTIFGDLQRILAEAGSDLRHLAKATYYVSDDNASQQLNALRPQYYDPARPPAASKAAVHGTGRSGTSVTVDMIAVPKEQAK